MRRNKCRTAAQYRQGMYRPGALLGPLGGMGQNAANWWEAGGYAGAVGAWRARGAVSLAASYVDLTGNGNNLSLGVAPPWSATRGWQSGGAHWLNTGLAPNTNSWCLFVMLGDNQANGSPMGVLQSGGQQYMNIRNSGGVGTAAVNYYAVTQWNSGLVANQQCRALVGLGDNTGQPYIDGVASGAPNGAWINGATPHSVYICAANWQGNPAVSPHTGDIWAAMIGSTTPTPAQVAAISAQIAAL